MHKHKPLASRARASKEEVGEVGSGVGGGADFLFLCFLVIYED